MQQELIMNQHQRWCHTKVKGCQMIMLCLCVNVTISTWALNAYTSNINISKQQYYHHSKQMAKTNKTTNTKDPPMEEFYYGHNSSTMSQPTFPKSFKSEQTRMTRQMHSAQMHRTQHFNLQLSQPNEAMNQMQNANKSIKQKFKHFDPLATATYKPSEEWKPHTRSISNG